MEEKEVSAASNCSSPDRKSVVLGVVNASEIKCKVDRKRRWDKGPGSDEEGSPPSKLLCDELMDNNICHDNILDNNDTGVRFPSQSTSNIISDNIAPLPHSQPEIVKEQNIQTSCQVLKNIGNKTSSSNVSNSFNDLNYSESNQRDIIETAKITTISDNDSKTSIEVISFPSSSDSLSRNSDNTIFSNIGEVPLNPDQDKTLNRPSENLSLDPDFKILDSTVSKLSEKTNPDLDPVLIKNQEHFDTVSENIKVACDNETSEITGSTELPKTVVITNKYFENEPKTSLIKSLVDYDDYSDESSQQSDKISQSEPAVKVPVDIVSVTCENSIDSKEEEFHDCFEQNNTDESICDSSSLSNVVMPAPNTDDLINNNPLEILQSVVLNDIDPLNPVASSKSNVDTEDEKNKLVDVSIVEKIRPTGIIVNEATRLERNLTPKELTKSDDSCGNNVNPVILSTNDGDVVLNSSSTVFCAEILNDDLLVLTSNESSSIKEQKLSLDPTSQPSEPLEIKNVSVNEMDVVSKYSSGSLTPVKMKSDKTNAGFVKFDVLTKSNPDEQCNVIVGKPPLLENETLSNKINEFSENPQLSEFQKSEPTPVDNIGLLNQLSPRTEEVASVKTIEKSITPPKTQPLVSLSCDNSGSTLRSYIETSSKCTSSSITTNADNENLQASLDTDKKSGETNKFESLELKNSEHLNLAQVKSNINNAKSNESVVIKQVNDLEQNEVSIILDEKETNCESPLTVVSEANFPLKGNLNKFPSQHKKEIHSVNSFNDNEVSKSIENLSELDKSTLKDSKALKKNKSEIEGNEPFTKTTDKDQNESSQVLIIENNSVLSDTALKIECESMDTQQSVDSVLSINESSEAPPIKAKVLTSKFINANSVVELSNSSSSENKDRSSLSFSLSILNNQNSVLPIEIDKPKSTNQNICFDDDSSNSGYIEKSKQTDSSKTLSPLLSKGGISSVKISASENLAEVISTPDSVSNDSKRDSILKTNLLKTKESFTESLASQSILQNKLSLSKTENVNPHDSKNVKVEGSLVTKRTKVKSEETLQMPRSQMGTPPNTLGSAESNDINETLEDRSKSDISTNLQEPITLRIFKKDNNALHSESGESPKRTQLEDSPKQLEFTLKISKDASSNIPKATMSPKRTHSPQRLPDPIFSRISSQLSITPVNSSLTESTTPKRQSKPVDSSSQVISNAINITETEIHKKVAIIPPHVNNIPEVVKMELNNCTSVSDSGDSSIIDSKDEIFSTISPVNISVRGGKRGGRKDVNVTPGPPKKRGRPPKRKIEDIPASEGEQTPSEYARDLVSSEADSTTDSANSRPVRECRDRTRPILGRPRKPRGRGGGRGGARVPLVPGREALSAREQEELDRIEARNQQIRLEKLAKREAKKAKREQHSDREKTPPTPPRELTEEEKAELAAKRESERKAAAEARALAQAEAQRQAEEAAAAKEAEKLAKILARKERLKEMHREKREKMLAKKAAKKLKDEERRKRKAAEKAAEQAAALQSMYEDETRMSAPDGSLRPLYSDDTPNRNKSGRMEISLHESNNYSVEQLAEYQWEEGELFMIQEQVAEYLGVKSFKRKYPDLKRRPVDAEERKYLEEAGLVPKSVCDLGITAVSSSEVLDIMFQDFPHKYEEVRKYLREKQMREISSKQRALSLYSKQSDKAKADLREQALECAASWNAHLNRERSEERKCTMDLQSFIIHYPHSKREKMTRKTEPPGHYPVAVLPGQYCDYYKRYTTNELMYYPLNSVLYGPLKPNERHLLQDDTELSESEVSSESESSSSSESDSESEGDENTMCKICNSSTTSRPDEGGGSNESPPAKPDVFLPCSKCHLLCHPSCCKITDVMLPHVRKYNWMCTTCKICPKCNSNENDSKMKLCNLCDRGYHISCLDARKMVPEGNRWHCAVCSFCWSCGTKEPGGPSNQWLHEFIKDENGEKVYQRSLCTTCCANVGKEAAAAIAAAAAAASSAKNQTVSTSGTVTPGTSAGTSIITTSTTNTPQSTPIKGFHLVQTKDGNQVRLTMSRGISSIMNRTPLAARTSDTLVLRNPTVRLQSITSSNRSESQVVRIPTVAASPSSNIPVVPNNRVQSPSSNVNGATDNEKK